MKRLLLFIILIFLIPIIIISVFYKYDIKNNITGFITIPDQQLKTINTPNGKVDCVEFIGVTNNELLALKNKEINVKKLYEKIGSDITSYNRKSVI